MCCLLSVVGVRKWPLDNCETIFFKDMELLIKTSSTSTTFWAKKYTIERTFFQTKMLGFIERVHGHPKETLNKGKTIAELTFCTIKLQYQE